jgi:predicted lipoprotein with Yx(FWY)xxD motif
MQLRSLAPLCVVVVAAFGIVGCGGGSGSGSPVYTAPTAAPAPQPTATATGPVASPSPGASPTSTAATTLTEVTLLGSAGFTNTNGRTVYVLSDDTTTSLACTVGSGCTGVWPPIAPPAGVALSTGFTAFTRPDNGMAQLAYMGHPLYEYSGDAAAGQTNGNGLVSFGGTWSVARP